MLCIHISYYNTDIIFVSLKPPYKFYEVVKCFVILEERKYFMDCE